MAEQRVALTDAHLVVQKERRTVEQTVDWSERLSAVWMVELMDRHWVDQWVCSKAGSSVMSWVDRWGYWTVATMADRWAGRTVE